MLVKFYDLWSKLTSFIFCYEFSQGRVDGFAVFELDLVDPVSGHEV
jgi:hypothetical protein